MCERLICRHQNSRPRSSKPPFAGFPAQKAGIDVQIAELRAMLDGGTKAAADTPEAPTGTRKKFSAAARKRMKEAQQRREAIRAVTDEQVPIAGTQMGYGGMLNLETHADLDYQDNHFYIDHYNFPHTAWDSSDWRIRDTSAVARGCPPS